MKGLVSALFSHLLAGVVAFGCAQDTQFASAPQKRMLVPEGDADAAGVQKLVEEPVVQDVPVGTPVPAGDVQPEPAVDIEPIAEPVQPTPTAVPVRPPSPEPPAEPTPQDPSPSSEPDPVLEACLASSSWADQHPFGPEDIDAAVVIGLKVDNLNASLVYRDAQESVEPRLVRLQIRSWNANAGTMELLDPQGWYCVDYLAKNVNNFVIRAHCSAHIVALDMNSQQAHGVRIERVGCGE